MSKNDGITLDDDSCLECGARYFVPCSVEGLCYECFISDLERDWENELAKEMT